MKGNLRHLVSVGGTASVGIKDGPELNECRNRRVKNVGFQIRRQEIGRV